MRKADLFWVYFLFFKHDPSANAWGNRVVSHDVT